MAAVAVIASEAVRERAWRPVGTWTGRDRGPARVVGSASCWPCWERTTLRVSSFRSGDDSAKRPGVEWAIARESGRRAAAGARRAAGVLVGWDAGVRSGTGRAMKSPTSRKAGKRAAKRKLAAPGDVRR